MMFILIAIHFDIIILYFLYIFRNIIEHIAILLLFTI